MTPVSTYDKTFEPQEGETLLEGLEHTGHEVEYQCRSSYCGSCRIKISDGRASYDDFPLAFVAPGGILPCCCRVHEGIKVDCRGRVSEPDLLDVGLFDEQDWSCCSKWLQNTKGSSEKPCNRSFRRSFTA